ncbi:hypothetical protein EW145_g2081 [Phellinidium pouzarii]|uniref:Pre-rRNA-processing protein PNO1 n=1 Tax=Phellinidium pouzarii TaxID=167371 RepID=A0A4S4LDX1_9AGAM|nr:hypothetical protein EW145_g2081 [Phellinidium pouzarii]
MVVANVPTPTSAGKKKNRRKEAKKALRVATDSEDVIEVEGGPSSPPVQAAAGDGIEGADDDDTLMIDDTDASATAAAALAAASGTGAPSYPPLSAAAQQAAVSKKSEMRRIPVPPHRLTPLKKEWVNIFGPLTELLGLQTSRHTKEVGALQKGADFVKAFALGFEVNDSIALLRIDDLYLDSFEIKDVKTLHGDHLSRAIGRIAGQDGKTKFTIENASRTRIILADTKIHILGSFQNIKIARDAIVSLILGSPPGKVYAGLRTVASRMRQRAI